MKRAVANMLSHPRMPEWIWNMYPRRLRVWCFLNGD